jgi:hypothetical protein
LNFLERFSKEAQTSSFIKIRPVGAELLREDVQTDGHDEANSRFSQFCERALKKKRMKGKKQKRDR